jgi:hypothetical protein
VLITAQEGIPMSVLHNAGVRVTLLVVAAALAGFAGGVGASFVYPAAAGTQGAAGPPGPKGAQGQPGVQGTAGPPGQSASLYTVKCAPSIFGASGPNDIFPTVVTGVGALGGFEYGQLSINCTVSP